MLTEGSHEMETLLANLMAEKQKMESLHVELTAEHDKLARQNADLCDEFPICSIEDGLAEDDWDGWKALTDTIGDRIAQAAGALDVDIIINLQADEPEIAPENIDTLTRLLVDNPDAPMATLVADFENAQQVVDPNVVKVIVGVTGKAIYFSRSPIPYDRDKAGVGDIGHYLRHLGIYAYRKDFLLKITSLPQTPLEKTEKLEQLRAVENGFDILVAKVKHTADGIDTPAQYAEFVKRYMQNRETR